MGSANLVHVLAQEVVADKPSSDAWTLWTILMMSEGTSGDGRLTT